jgi:hypothetical protein
MFALGLIQRRPNHTVREEVLVVECSFVCTLNDLQDVRTDLLCLCTYLGLHLLRAHLPPYL